MLEVQRIKRAAHVVADVIVFILIDERSLQEGVFKVLKK